jgi:hypothetical protein
MPLAVTSSLTNWQFQKTHVERNMDSAAYEAAHPDDTLILAGPTRLGDADTAASDNNKVPLLPIGMVQQITWTQQKPTQPMMAIGSGRSFFTSGKATTSWSMARLLMNGRNLLNVLYHTAKVKGVDVSQFDDPASASTNSQFFTNLDSELYMIPIGIGMIFRNKVHDWIGAFYAEAAVINSYSIGFTAGQSMTLEQVSGVCDRLLPMSMVSVAGQGYTPRSTIDQIIGFANGTGPSKVGGADANTTSPGIGVLP